MRDLFDALQDARAELVGDGIFLSTREAVALSLGATHGADLYPHLRDRHPFGMPVSRPEPASSPLVGMTPSGSHPTPLPGMRADGDPLPDLAA